MVGMIVGVIHELPLQVTHIAGEKAIKEFKTTPP